MAMSEASARQAHAQEALVESLWVSEPKRKYVVPPNRKLTVLLTILSGVLFLGMVAMMAITRYLMNTQVDVMRIIRSADFAGLEEGTKDLRAFAKKVRIAAEESRKVPDLESKLSLLQNESEALNKYLVQFQKVKIDLKEQVETLTNMTKGSGVTKKELAVRFLQQSKGEIKRQVALFAELIGSDRKGMKSGALPRLIEWASTTLQKQVDAIKSHPLLSDDSEKAKPLRTILTRAKETMEKEIAILQRLALVAEKGVSPGTAAKIVQQIKGQLEEQMDALENLSRLSEGALAGDIPAGETQSAKGKAKSLLESLNKENWTLTSALEDLQRMKMALQVQIEVLQARLEKAGGNIEEIRGEYEDQLSLLRSVALRAVRAYQEGLRFDPADPDSEKKWRHWLKEIKTAQNSLLALMKTTAPKNRKETQQLFREMTDTAALLRARQLRDASADQMLVDMVGPKFMKSLSKIKQKLDGELSVTVTAEVIAPFAGYSEENLNYARGEGLKDEKPLQENWLAMKNILTREAGSDSLQQARNYSQAIFSRASKIGWVPESDEGWIKKQLGQFSTLRQTYTNPIPAIVADEQTDRALGIFVTDLKKELEGQQPYVLWSLAKFGNRLLQEAAVQPPFIEAKSNWRLKAELEKPFVLLHRPHEFRIMEYEAPVCNILSGVDEYPSQAFAYSCSTEKIPGTKNSLRKATIELTPGTYFLHNAMATEDNLVLTIKGKFALESVPIFISGSPYGVFVEIPYDESTGYWCTPLFGRVYAYDAKLGSSVGDPLRPAKKNSLEWKKYNLLVSGESVAWPQERVRVVQKFLDILKDN